MSKNDENRKDIIPSGTFTPAYFPIFWLPIEELAGELRLSSEARFDSARSDLELGIFLGLDNDRESVSGREDQRAGREL